MARRPTVHLDEDTDVGPDGLWYSGLFTGHLDDGSARPGPDDIVEGRPLDEALEWARARAKRIEVSIGDGECYSAGSQKVGGHPPLPDPAPKLSRRRSDGDLWRDRTPDDPPIRWTYCLLLEPPGFTESFSLEALQEARTSMRAAAQAVADARPGAGFSDEPIRTLIKALRSALRDIDGDEDFTFGTGGAPAFSVRGKVVASTGDQVRALAEPTLDGDLAGWSAEVELHPASS